MRYVSIKNYLTWELLSIYSFFFFFPSLHLFLWEGKQNGFKCLCLLETVSWWFYAIFISSLVMLDFLFYVFWLEMQHVMSFFQKKKGFGICLWKAWLYTVFRRSGGIPFIIRAIHHSHIMWLSFFFLNFLFILECSWLLWYCQVDHKGLRLTYTCIHSLLNSLYVHVSWISW